MPPQIMAQSVGVVMSGGGAKGLYHIGVLRALEENNIPIDYIAGTSMGSIVGALYASGYSIEKMEQIALSGDLERWVSGRIDEKYIYYHAERDRMSSMIKVHIGDKSHAHDTKKQIILPGSVMNTAEIDLALNALFAEASAAAQEDFDRLMIPFRCMATHMSEHRAVELSKGNLPLAIRASMALPVAFPPVVIDSVLMCDGGCYDNFPWRAIEENFHPDIIIGACCVDIDNTLAVDASVVEQVMSLITKPSDFELPADRSVFIQRAVNASVLDFGKAAEIMAAGYNDALEAMPRIKALISRRMPTTEVEQRRERFRNSAPKPMIGNVDVVGLTPQQRYLVERMMNIGHARPNDTLPMTAAEVSDRYLTILANGPLNSEFPTFTYNDTTQRYDIRIPFRVKPMFDIAIGGNISSTAFNQAYIGLSYERWGSVKQKFIFDALLGPVYTMSRLKGRTTLVYNRPIYFDYSLNFNIHNTLYGNFGNLTPIDNADKMRMMELFLSLGSGAVMDLKSVADITLNIGRNSYSYAMEGYAKRQYTHFDYIAPQFAIERSTLNKSLFPTSGSKLHASAIYVYGRDVRNTPSQTRLTLPEQHIDMIRQWWGVKVDWRHYISTPRARVSLGYALEGVYTNHPQFDSREATILSSPQYAPLLHSAMIYMPEFRANRYLGVGFMPTLRLYDNLYLRLSAYAMLRDKYDNTLLHYMSDLSLIYHTPIGPISLALTKYNFHNSKNLYLTFNFGYAIFGNKGLYY